MNRNSEARFSSMPTQTQVERSVFPFKWRMLCTGNAGFLYPIDFTEIVPGDRITGSIAGVIRMQTMVKPVMDDCFADLYTFFVPNRLVWEHWEAFQGEADPNSWTNPTDYQIPHMSLSGPGAVNSLSRYNVGSKTAADYLGLPVATKGNGSDASMAANMVVSEISTLPFRAYRLIWNEWFRDQNLMEPELVNKGDLDGDPTLFERIYPVCKVFDRFTGALPAPQRGEAVMIPWDSNMTGGYIPVGATDGLDGTPAKMNLAKLQQLGFDSSLNFVRVNSSGSQVGSGTGPLGLDSFGALTPPSSGSLSASTDDIYPNNLSGYVGLGPSINALRQAFQVQRILEKKARGGNRYVEVLRSLWNVSASDARLQRPEYVAGTRQYINVTQVVQQSSTNDVTPQGNVSGYSKTDFNSAYMDKAFTEHGYLITLCCVRTHHTYQQGIDPEWTRKDYFDFYQPALAHLGEQPILNEELYCYYDNGTLQVGNNGWNKGVFGYQEAWSSYRYKRSHVAAEMRSGINGSLDVWHYADYYTSQPYLSADWIRETQENIDRTLAVPSTAGSDQFLMDFYFDWNAGRPMPLYSIPGLLDHF